MSLALYWKFSLNAPPFACVGPSPKTSHGRARYNVQIDDVNKLINTALGGDPVGTLYEGDRRFDIVVKLDRAAVASPQAIADCPSTPRKGCPCL